MITSLSLEDRTRVSRSLISTLAVIVVALTAFLTGPRLAQAAPAGIQPGTVKQAVLPATVAGVAAELKAEKVHYKRYRKYRKYRKHRRFRHRYRFRRKYRRHRHYRPYYYGHYAPRYYGRHHYYRRYW
ncbi:MAG: hypothetical protein AAFV69_06165 [Pseudomonadota bacterium]